MFKIKENWVVNNECWSHISRKKITADWSWLKLLITQIQLTDNMTYSYAKYLEMKCYKYTIVCPGGGDKLETSTRFMGTLSILLLLILCHCPYSLTRMLIRGSKKRWGLKRDWARIIKQHYKRERKKSVFSLSHLIS